MAQEKFEEIVTITSQEEIGTDIYSMWISAGQIAAQQKPDSLYRYTAMTAAVASAPDQYLRD